MAVGVSDLGKLIWIRLAGQNSPRQELFSLEEESGFAAVRLRRSSIMMIAYEDTDRAAASGFVFKVHVDHSKNYRKTGFYLYTCSQ